MIVECPGCRRRYDVTGRPPGTRARCRCGEVFQLPDAPRTAATLNCPECGAVCPPDRDRCAYCKAVLAIIACPRCFGMLFRGSKHCVHCGAEVDVPARAMPDGTATPLACPRCTGGGKTENLIANLVGGTLLDECAACGGVWLNRAALEQVLAERDRPDILHAAGARFTTASAPIAQEQVVYLPCPECGTRMRRHNFGRKSGVIVDTCKDHGTWFDRDELRRVIEFVQSGGLEAARQAEVEELKRQAEAERAAARTTGPIMIDHSYRGRDSSAIDSFVEAICRLFVP